MKKVLSFLLSAILLVSLCVPALAESKFDFSYVKENSSIYEISVDSDQDCAFITTTLSVSDRSFTHELDSSTRYSSFQSDILVNDYYGKTPHGIFRTWITYAADEELNITSVSFFLDDKEYIFSGIGDKKWHYQFDDGIIEQVLIIFDNSSEHVEFLSALAEVAQQAINNLGEDDAEPCSVKMVLHGTKDVTATVEDGPLLDWVTVFLAFINSNGNLNDTSGSTLKIVNAK